VNLAAIHRDDVRDKTDYTRTNVHGAENVAKVCSIKNIRKIIFTSTVAVYGFADPKTGIKGKINPFNQYGQSKFEAEQKLQEWQVQGTNSLIIVRPTVIFGEGNRGNVYSLFKQIASQKFLMIGSGQNTKSLAYIRNVVAFLEKAIVADETFGIYNYTDIPDLTMNALIKKIHKTLNIPYRNSFYLPVRLGFIIGFLADIVAWITGKKLPLSTVRVKKFVTTTSFKTNKSDLCSFIAPYSLEEALEKTLRYEFIANKKSDDQVFYTE
jgi:nucleoside-diphosphate-sugar epimerase